MVSQTKSGKESHKEMGDDVPYLMKLYYTNRTVLFLVCGGNELFYIFLYCFQWSTGSWVTFGLMVSFPVFAFKQLMNLIQLKEASCALANSDLESHKKQK
jgi:CDP-diacylglycerol--inositol 3-phosphatidyltransferase